MKKVLLLGGAGFIGFNIAKTLLARGDCYVTIGDNFFRAGGRPDGPLEDLAKSSRVDLIGGDFTDRSSFEKLGSQYDEVYMLASVVGVDYVNSAPHEIIRINTMLILNTLEWLRSVKCRKVVFTSSSEVYAGSVEAFGYPIPTDELVPITIQDPGHPRFTYAITKTLGESGFLNYAKILGFECSIVRYHNVYGPRMGFKHVIPHLAQRFSAGESPFMVYGHEQTRSFNYIDDAVQGTILTMERGRTGEIYHIGSSEEITISELVKFTGELFGYDGSYEDAPTYPGSVNRRCPDISKAVKELGYSPEVGWKLGVSKTIAWYRAFLERGDPLHESFYDKKGRVGSLDVSSGNT